MYLEQTSLNIGTEKTKTQNGKLGEEKTLSDTLCVENMERSAVNACYLDLGVVVALLTIILGINVKLLVDLIIMQSFSI